MSAIRQFHPVTDGMLDHLAINGCTLERIAQALLKYEAKDDLMPSPSKIIEHEITVQMATIALRSVLPRNLEHVPAKKSSRSEKNTPMNCSHSKHIFKNL